MSGGPTRWNIAEPHEARQLRETWSKITVNYMLLVKSYITIRVKMQLGGNVENLQTTSMCRYDALEKVAELLTSRNKGMGEAKFNLYMKIWDNAKHDDERSRCHRITRFSQERNESNTEPD